MIFLDINLMAGKLAPGFAFSAGMTYPHAVGRNVFRPASVTLISQTEPPEHSPTSGDFMKSTTPTLPAKGKKSPTKKAKKAPGSGRQSTYPHVKTQVLVRAAGRCEQCGKDLTQDHRLGKATYWGEVAHIQPASSIGPRSVKGYRGSDAKNLTNDPDNLMLLCGGCHELIDKDPDGYPTTDLVQYHLDHVAQIAHAASVGETRRAVGLIFLPD